jgi:uncharacterized membrane protein
VLAVRVREFSTSEWPWCMMIFIRIRKNNDMNSLIDLGHKWWGGGIRIIETLYLLNSSPEVSIIEWRGMGWTVHVARMWKIINARPVLAVCSIIRTTRKNNIKM